MAHVSEIIYKETRDANGAVYSRQMQATVVLGDREMPYPLDAQAQAEAVVGREGMLLVEFVKEHLDGKCPDFKRGDELAKPKDKMNEGGAGSQSAMPAGNPVGSASPGTEGRADSEHQNRSGAVPVPNPSTDEKKEMSKPAAPSGLKVDYRVGAFLKDKPGWDHCPFCGSKDIDHVKHAPGQPERRYQGCFDCKVFLNVDGKVVGFGGSR